MTEQVPEKLRLDKWLWHARLFKSRTLAAQQIASGGFRVNRIVVRKSHHTVQPGDVVTFPKGPYVRVVEIIALGTRRGPAPEAQALYQDLNPPDAQPKPERKLGAARREVGAGRPTKKDRREIERLLGRP
ncbi:MAG: RNA-binding S4 domain-containing protein [Alphaproteobacteria bacterium]|nr:RNA-binding S4 domain-containing protein [Alphaproteobacteria bacterium]